MPNTVKEWIEAGNEKALSLRKAKYKLFSVMKKRLRKRAKQLDWSFNHYLEALHNARGTQCFQEANSFIADYQRDIAAFNDFPQPTQIQIDFFLIELNILINQMENCEENLILMAEYEQCNLPSSYFLPQSGMFWISPSLETDRGDQSYPTDNAPFESIGSALG